MHPFFLKHVYKYICDLTYSPLPPVNEYGLSQIYFGGKTEIRLQCGTFLKLKVCFFPYASNFIN